MALLHLRDVTLSFGLAPILDQTDLVIQSGERVCLVGRNGAGKSSLMSIISGHLAPDSGQVIRAPELKIAYLPQDVPDDLDGSVFEVVASGLNDVFAKLAEFEQVSSALASDSTPQLMEQLEGLQAFLDEANGWDAQGQVGQHLRRFGLDGEQSFSDLSGGMKRRVLLARCLLSKPHLLMLDEPTNHLDIDAIQWLESFLCGFGGAILFVTHDRMFLRKVATRIVDLDRGKLTSWPGDFDLYQTRKQAALDAELAEWARFDKKLAEEEAWIRQGIKARRTRNEGRVRALKKLRNERSERRDRVGQAKINLQTADRSGKDVIKAKGLTFSWPDKPIVSDLSITIKRGDRVGIIGPNGCGKTTLIRLLLGEIEPEAGAVELGTRLEPLYFDQLRDQLRADDSVRDNISDGHDTVIVNGHRRHVIGYLKDFLFSAQRARSPVSSLSGGEQNRLLLARLFTKPANLLIMDEPTNDLDAETLELLETTLLEFDGTILIVSHDREFLNNVVTTTIGFDPDGIARAYVGGYDDWCAQRPQPEDEPPPVAKAPQQTAGLGQPPKARKLSFKERQELAALPEQIEDLEAEKARLHEALMNPSLYQTRRDEVGPLQTELEGVEDSLNALYERWALLEDIESS